jgi:hypothetical protein
VTGKLKARVAWSLGPFTLQPAEETFTVRKEARSAASRNR